MTPTSVCVKYFIENLLDNFPVTYTIDGCCSDLGVTGGTIPPGIGNYVYVCSTYYPSITGSFSITVIGACPCETPTPTPTPTETPTQTPTLTPGICYEYTIRNDEETKDLTYTISGCCSDLGVTGGTIPGGESVTVCSSTYPEIIDGGGRIALERECPCITPTPTPTQTQTPTPTETPTQTPTPTETPAPPCILYGIKNNSRENPLEYFIDGCCGDEGIGAGSLPPGGYVEVCSTSYPTLSGDGSIDTIGDCPSCE
jgi:hypothetical protein